MREPFWRVVCLAALCLALVIGCGKEGGRRPLTGSVTFQGKPVEGTITFLADGRPVCGALIRAGHFSIPAAQGLDAGTYRVAISVPVPGGVRTPEEIAAGASPRAKESLPSKYNAETVLTADVKSSGSNDLEYRLE